MKITKRTAKVEDTEFARTVHHIAYHDVVVRQFGGWDEEKQNSFFKNDWNNGEGFEIILLDNIPCGYYSFEERENEIIGKELVLLPEFQGKGIGTNILTELIELSKVKNKVLKIGALKENKALELYRRLGFKDSEKNETHIELTFKGDTK